MTDRRNKMVIESGRDIIVVEGRRLPSGRKVVVETTEGWDRRTLVLLDRGSVRRLHGWLSEWLEVGDE